MLEGKSSVVSSQKKRKQDGQSNGGHSAKGDNKRNIGKNKLSLGESIGTTEDSVGISSFHSGYADSPKIGQRKKISIKIRARALASGGPSLQEQSGVSQVGQDSMMEMNVVGTLGNWSSAVSDKQFLFSSGVSASPARQERWEQ